MKAVFDTKPNSGYDDEIVRRYHFPALGHYMAAGEAAVGDWVVYREPQPFQMAHTRGILRSVALSAT
jgi:putative restriction endonuclease